MGIDITFRKIPHAFTERGLTVAGETSPFRFPDVGKVEVPSRLSRTAVLNQGRWRSTRPSDHIGGQSAVVLVAWGGP